jgi:hypothetical protein
MYVLGHLGLTIGLLLFGIYIFDKSDFLKIIDFRIILLFALLPDIIDKIIGHLVFQESINNGRIFSHTLIFIIVFVIVFSSIVGKLWWIYCYPVIIHQIYDMMWLEPETWFWPYFGWRFNAFDIDLLEHWWTMLTTDPFTIITEILGFTILLILIIYFKFYQKDNLLRFFKNGRLV